MAVSLLIVTPHPSFGEAIRQNLEETHSYRVQITTDAPEAIAYLEEQDCTHVLLDMDLKNVPVLDLGLALRTVSPKLDIIIISGNGTLPPAYNELRPWTIIRKPFYLPDLLEMLSETPLEQKSKLGRDTLIISPEEDTGKMELPWLDDVSKAAQHLTRLTLESSAQAALIVRAGKMWAYAGELSQPAAQELASTVALQKKAGDLLRFIRLKATQAEHMLYATELASGVVLAMVFDAETPFSTIRSQATSLAESLSLSKAMPLEATEAPSEPEPVDSVVENPENLEDLDLPPIADILSNVPTPNPGQNGEGRPASLNVRKVSREDAGRLRESVRAESVPMADPYPSVSPQSRPTFSREASPAIPIQETMEKEQVVFLEEAETSYAEPEHQQAGLGTTRVSPVQRPETPMRRPDYDELAETQVSAASQRPETPLRRPLPDALDETRPHSITEVTGRVLSQTSSPTDGVNSGLTYACLLVPRFSTHHLAGDLADRISEWMPHVCVAYAWRLEHISVRPDYLQWVVNVPPTTSPGYLMRILRQKLSENIFDDFPRLKKENPSGDFWAPGYLIMGGSQPHPSKLVKDYIERTRVRQGM